MRRSALHLLSGAALLASGLLTGTTAAAEEIRLQPLGERREAAGPVRGMTMERVQDAWGEPRERQAPVGDPPITRWEYDRFVVYFEYQYVLHTVVKRGR